MITPIYKISEPPQKEAIENLKKSIKNILGTELVKVDNFKYKIKKWDLDLWVEKNGEAPGSGHGVAIGKVIIWYDIPNYSDGVVNRLKDLVDRGVVKIKNK